MFRRNPCFLALTTLAVVAVLSEPAVAEGEELSPSERQWIAIQASAIQPPEDVQRDLLKEAAALELPPSELAAEFVKEWTSPTSVTIALAPSQSVGVPIAEADGTETQGSCSDCESDEIVKTPLVIAQRKGDMFYYPSETYGFNHAHIAIYRWRGSVVEAANASLGVRKITVADRNRKTQGVPKGQTYILAAYTSTFTQREAAASYANAQVGQDYRSPYSPNRKMSAPYNCSQLVWAAYRSAANWDLDVDGGYWVLPRNIIENQSKIGYYKKI